MAKKTVQRIKLLVQSTLNRRTGKLVRASQEVAGWELCASGQQTVQHMKKYILIIAIVASSPSIALAAWWNPMSWGIFSFIFHTQPQVETTIMATSSNETGADISPNTTVSDSSTTISTEESSSPVVTPVTKIIKKVSPTPPVTVQTQSPQQQIGTLCNGTYWKECPVGQNFICPSTGNAYCQPPQQPVQQPVLQKDNYQICRDTYGHATWDGFSFTASGGPNCSCDAGYGPSSDGKSCTFLQATQQVQQPDMSISNSACQTAVQNLKDFQTDYAGGYAGLSTSGTSNIAAQLSAIFANQYNTELPAYQIAAQAACQVPASNMQCQTALDEFNTFRAQYPIKQLVGMSTRGDAFALRFPAQQTEIQYSCQ